MNRNAHKDISVQIIAGTYLKNMYVRIVTNNNRREDILATLQSRVLTDISCRAFTVCSTYTTLNVTDQFLVYIIGF